MYKVEIAPAAEKQIKALPKKEQEKIIKKVYKLFNDPLPQGVKKLKGIDSL
jgi:mRNA-degrading endonuclease RelE of RelBE toxin-antitoxin system